MTSPFLPSSLAQDLVAAPLEQQVSLLVTGPDKLGGTRDPLYRADAEGKVAPFIRRCMEATLPDRREYAVLHGGKTAYTSPEARRKLCPSTPADHPDIPGRP